MENEGEVDGGVGAHGREAAHEWGGGTAGGYGRSGDYGHAGGGGRWGGADAGHPTDPSTGGEGSLVERHWLRSESMSGATPILVMLAGAGLGAALVYLLTRGSDDDDDEVEEEPPRRGRSARGGRPPGGRGRYSEWDEEEDED